MMFFAAVLACGAGVVGIGVNLWEHDISNAFDALSIAFWAAAYAVQDLNHK